MRLISFRQGITKGHALANMGFRPLVAGQTDEITPPTADELKLLREEIDPDRVVIGKIG